MTPTEAGKVLLMMQASWPQLAPDDVAARLWVEDLIGCDHGAALKTFRQLRNTETFPPTWATFREVYAEAERPSIKEQIALEGPREPINYGNGSYAEIRARQREERMMERIRNRPHHPQPIVHHFDALTPSLTYDEVYDEEGNLRSDVDANGYPVTP